MTTNSDAGERAMLRHTLATLAYRAAKVLRDPPPGFASHAMGAGLRTPVQIVGHLGDLLDWASALAVASDARWQAGSVGTWEPDVDRFFAALAKLDAHLASGAALAHPAGQIFQAPVADAFTHVGQLAMLRRHAGGPIKPESYAKADIVPGCVGREQTPARKEFDGDASGKR